MGRAVRACSDVVRAGWLAWQALVSGGRGPVGPENQVYWLPARAVLWGAGLGKQCLRMRRFFGRWLRVEIPETAKFKNLNYLSKTISTGRPTLMKNLAKA